VLVGQHEVAQSFLFWNEIAKCDTFVECPQHNVDLAMRRPRFLERDDEFIVMVSRLRRLADGDLINFIVTRPADTDNF
jgi:hypothetical protein